MMLATVATILKRFALVALATSLLVSEQTSLASIAAKPPKHTAARVDSPPQPVAPLLGICDGAGALDVLGDLSDADPHKKRIQISLLEGRIIDCSRKITDEQKNAPAPTPTPYWVSAAPAPSVAPTPSDVCTSPPPATTDSNRFALYEILQRCSAYWTATNGSAATPAAVSTPLPSIASRPTFYVFATGAVDPTTSTVLIRSIVKKLTEARRKAVPGGPHGNDADALADVVVAGRAGWTTTDSFTAQCQLDPNTRGALVIRTSLSETYRNNYLLLVANFTTVSASVEMLGCGAEDHNEAASPLSLYSRQAITGKAHEDAITLGIFSSIAAVLATSKSKTTVTTGSGQTTITKTDSSAPVLTGSVIGYFENENLNLPAQNASVELNVAGRRFADTAMLSLRELCGEPEIRRLAREGNPQSAPPAPPEHRTLLYKAAYEYIDDCNLFANFGM